MRDKLKKLRYIKSPRDLITPNDATQIGFFQQALRKTKEANPYIEAAKSFLEKLQNVKNVQELIEIKDIRDELITSAGFSEKAKIYFLSLN